MAHKNKEISQHKPAILNAKYLQLGKYVELSDIELTVVAGGSPYSVDNCRTPRTWDCTSSTGSRTSLPTKMFPEA